MNLVHMKTQIVLTFIQALMLVITIKHSVACATNLVQLEEEVIEDVAGVPHSILPAYAIDLPYQSNSFEMVYNKDMQYQVTNNFI